MSQNEKELELARIAKSIETDFCGDFAEALAVFQKAAAKSYEVLCKAIIEMHNNMAEIYVKYSEEIDGRALSQEEKRKIFLDHITSTMEEK